MNRKHELHLFSVSDFFNKIICLYFPVINTKHISKAKALLIWLAKNYSEMIEELCLIKSKENLTTLIVA